MTWTDRHLMSAHERVNVAYEMLSVAYNELDEQFLNAKALINSAHTIVGDALRELGTLVHERTERP